VNERRPSETTEGEVAVRIAPELCVEVEREANLPRERGA